MPYNENYRVVFVSSLDGIIPFMKKRESTLSIADGKKIINSLKKKVTW
ncbi:MAG: hypothetical protein H2B00_07155 [Nitrosopumilaceae archaeon]|jgi:hypothetical protein|uniref:Uncharacterized protein n=1 Tax=Candidatus Nitrosomaritimum aestuariumsis TaxID=3342354 RepID=A0AC60W041_9ARCH|nr:hypothetical protein [Nitrosopumilaceae archaeon]MBA4459344.1 hypothetical protein [Nitrosopumilaceae archaeon]MBA4462275.1 hypothetical protein [Nitrosopumilaceae archaeon]NCF22089.1 hypothetical protein [Nitrosopumilaceae archaeon]